MIAGLFVPGDRVAHDVAIGGDQRLWSRHKGVQEPTDLVLARERGRARRLAGQRPARDVDRAANRQRHRGVVGEVAQREVNLALAARPLERVHDDGRVHHLR